MRSSMVGGAQGMVLNIDSPISLKIKKFALEFLTEESCNKIGICLGKKVK